jgi:membrane protease YdiL (CAAX protease family)
MEALVSEVRLTGSDKRALILWIVLGIVGVIFAQKYYFRAFPEASVNFQVSREEALTRAKNFVSGLGENVGGYQSTIVFSVDDHAKVYLERERGLQQANELMSKTLNIWYWDIRFFKPLQVEEFNVRVNPAGEIAGYEHKIEESRAGATLDRATAQSAATNFLTGKLAVNLKDWDFLPEESNPKRKPARVDWDFTWERHAFRAKDAPYRFTVSLHGDRIGGAEQYLQVPEAWTRSFRQLRSKNDFLAELAIIPYLLLLGAAIWLAIVLTRRGQTSWGLALRIGLFVALLLFLMQLNSWPVERASYDTNISYGVFILQQVAKALLFGLANVLTITLVLPGAEPLYRAFLPGRLRLRQALTLRGLRSKEFFSSAVVGISMAAFHIGFVVAFYVVATHFGAWAPQEINYENSVNTAFPWIAGVAIGFLASTNEEFTFRLFAIPFLHRLTGSRFLAVLVPAFCWSFLHSNYPQEPPYIRGIEIGIMGIVAGLVMLRWGILATLIWHYTVDASLVGLFLLRSNNLYFKISGVIVGAAALAPLALAAISYLARGRFETDEDLLNRAEPAPEIEFGGSTTVVEQETSPRRYKALAPAMLALLILCLFAGGMMAWRGKSSAIGDYLRLSVDARTAKTRADETLRQRGVDPSSYYHAVIFVDMTDPVTNEFLRRQLGIAGVNAIYSEKVPGALWRIRYFRDRQTEEFRIFLKPDGSLHSLRHTIPEDAPGDSLAKEDAVTLGEKFLREEKRIDVRQWSLVESNSEKRRHRIDHALTWQQNTPLDASATSHADAAKNAFARIDLQILGSEVTDYRAYVKIPDDWRRKQEETTLSRAVFGYAMPILFYAGLGLTLVIIFLKNLRSDAARSIPWRRIVLWASWSVVGYVLVFAFGNRIATFLNAYQTEIPFKIMVATLAIFTSLGLPFYFGTFAVVFGIAWYYASLAFGHECLPGWSSMPSRYYRDALCIGLGGAAVLIGLRHLSEFTSAKTTTLYRSMQASVGTHFDALLPALSILGTTLLRSLLWTGLVALLASFLAAWVRQTSLRVPLFFLGVLALVGSNWISPAGFVQHFVGMAITLGLLILGVRYVMRLNILGCFLIVAGSSLFGGAAELLAQPDAFYRANGYAVVLALVLLFAWPFAAWRMGSSAAAG